LRSLQLAAALAVVLAASASASTITYSGNFVEDDSLAYFRYSTHSVSQVFVYTTSYADPLHGFVPELFLFDPSGVEVKRNDGYSNIPSGDAALDYVSIFPDQFYTIVLSQHDNEPIGLLTDGFTRDGQPDFTTDISGFPGPFRDPGGDQLTGFWSVTFFSADPTLEVVPEPGTVWLGVAGVLLVVCRARSRARPATK
jgi:hypothetical protein